MTKTPIEINKRFGDINTQLDNLLKKEPEAIGPIFNFRRSINGVSFNHKKIIENHSRRQQLIDMQVAAEDFSGDMHEKYHEINAELDSDLDNYFTSLKSSLNRFPPLIVKLIPHELRRGLVTKSFGSFLNSLEKQDIDNEFLRGLKGFILSKGRRIDNSINEYRDKHIEHVQKMTHTTLISTSSSIKKIHTEIKEGGQAKALSSESKGTKTPVVKLESENGYVWHIHVRAQEGVLGKKISSGESFGEASDGNTGHFDKYGPHTHVYSSPQITLNPTSNEVSPEVNESLEIVSEYFQGILENLRK